jgi:hypothetical protein
MTTLDPFGYLIGSAVTANQLLRDVENSHAALHNELENRAQAAYDELEDAVLDYWLVNSTLQMTDALYSALHWDYGEVLSEALVKRGLATRVDDGVNLTQAGEEAGIRDLWSLIEQYGAERDL